MTPNGPPIGFALLGLRVHLALGDWGLKALHLVYWLGAAGVAWGGMPALAGVDTTPDKSPPALILTNAAQILALTPAEAKTGLPVQIRGFVTCYDPGMVLFVQDETGGIFVYHTGDRLPLRAGQYVLVSGLARPGRYSPIIDSPTIQPAASGPNVQPFEVSLAQVYQGGLDAQWVEVTGEVSTLNRLQGRLVLELVDPPHRINVIIPASEQDKHRELEGSLVRVRAVVGASFNDRRLEKFQLFASDITDITVLRAPIHDPFQTPPYLIKDLSTPSARRVPLNRVRVQGTVTLSGLGQSLFIQDSSGGLEVRSHAPVGDLPPGTAVDVVGIPGPVLESPRLYDAVIQRHGTNAPPRPVDSSVENLLHYKNLLVQVDAQFLGLSDWSSNRLTLALQGGHQVFTARLELHEARRLSQSFEPGSTVRVVGVAYPTGGAAFESGIPSLLLRSLADLSFIAPPAKARPFGLEALATGALLTTLALGAALWFLYQQRRQTETALRLQTSLQAEMRQSEQQLRRSMEEREGIGRDLHDDIIQSIYAVGLNLEDCRRIIRQTPEQAESRLAAAIHTLNNTIRSVRGFIAGLEPKVLNGHEFKTALKSLALTAGDAPVHFQIEVDPTAAKRLTSTEATQLLHIAKEAMSNSLRHAHASSVTVSLHSMKTGIRLEIQDDGVGFDPKTTDGSGHGLRNTFARARQIDADIEIISAPSQGCRILISVPQRNLNEPH